MHLPRLKIGTRACDWNPCHVTMTLADDELTFNRLIGLKIGYKIAIS